MTPRNYSYDTYVFSAIVAVGVLMCAQVGLSHGSDGQLTKSLLVDLVSVTGRFALVIFLVSYLTPTLRAQGLLIGLLLEANQRGISAALAIIFNFYLIAMYAVFIDSEVWYAHYFGGIAITGTLLLMAMAVSRNKTMSMLWKQASEYVRLAGMYYMWVIFVVFYMRGAFLDGFAIAPFVVLIGLVLAVLMRLVTSYLDKKRQVH